MGAALAAMGLLAAVVSFTPVVRWWATKLAGPWDDPKGDILIVLSGSTIDTGVMGHTSYWRSAYALLFYRQGACQRILITGGGGDGDVPVAEMMKTFLISGGVPPESIEVETRSRNTWESAQQVSGMLANKTGRKILLTSDLHMFRAIRMFRKAGLDDVLPRPVPDARKRAVHWNQRWGVFLGLCRESVAIAYYWIRGRL